MDVTDTDTKTTSAPISEFDAGEELLNRWKTDDAPGDSELSDDEQPKKKPVKQLAKEEPEDTPGETEDKGDEGSDEETEEATEREFLDKDDVYVKIKVDGKEEEFSVKDLKRLAGQEAALTRKSQEVATRRSALETAATTQVKAYEGLLERARAKWEPFSKVDFLALAKDPEVSAETLTGLRSLAQEAWDNVNYLEKGMGDLTKEIQTRTHTERVEAAKKCIEVLTDPDKGIEGFGEPLYMEMVSYATKNAGLDKEFVDTLTDPNTFKLIHKAMLFDKGKAKVVITKKASDAAKAVPKKVVKNSKTLTGKDVGKSGVEAAEAKLRKSGSPDDAAELLLARWKASAED